MRNEWRADAHQPDHERNRKHEIMEREHSHRRAGDGHDDDHGRDHGDHGDHGDDGIWARVKHAVVPHSHDANETIQSAEEASSDGIRAAWIGLAGMMATAILQIFIVYISGSIALLADTLHNVGHAVTTIPLVIAFKLGRRKPTKNYSYGYRRAEDLVGVFITLVIAASVVLIVWESIEALINPRPLSNLWWVFAAGLVGALGNELVAIYRIRAGKRIGSAALIAEGQHARADGLTSLAVVAGVLGVWAGFPRADAIVGLFIAAAILGIMVSSLKSIIRRLMDGVEPGLVDQITAVVEAVPGVESVGRARARWSGHRLEADVDISVDAGLTVLDGHAVAENVLHQLLHGVKHLQHAAVHVNPLVDGVEPERVHELSEHHRSPEARERYRASQRSASESAVHAH